MASRERNSVDDGVPYGNGYEWPHGRTVTASAEEIQYAQTLRQRIREAYARMPLPPRTVWWLDVD